jgi:hypothetical protein
MSAGEETGHGKNFILNINNVSTMNNLGDLEAQRPHFASNAQGIFIW